MYNYILIIIIIYHVVANIEKMTGSDKSSEKRTVSLSF